MAETANEIAGKLKQSREQTQDAEKHNLRLAEKLDENIKKLRGEFATVEWYAVEFTKAKKKARKAKGKLKALRTEFAELLVTNDKLKERCAMLDQER